MSGRILPRIQGNSWFVQTKKTNSTAVYLIAQFSTTSACALQSLFCRLFEKWGARMPFPPPCSGLSSLIFISRPDAEQVHTRWTLKLRILWQFCWWLGWWLPLHFLFSFLNPHWILVCSYGFFIIFKILTWEYVYFFLERGEGRRKEREERTSVGCLLFVLQLEMKPKT